MSTRESTSGLLPTLESSPSVLLYSQDLQLTENVVISTVAPKDRTGGCRAQKEEFGTTVMQQKS